MKVRCPVCEGEGLEVGAATTNDFCDICNGSGVVEVDTYRFPEDDY